MSYGYREGAPPESGVNDPTVHSTHRITGDTVPGGTHAANELSYTKTNNAKTAAAFKST
jgi:hypothetical protein